MSSAFDIFASLVLLITIIACAWILFVSSKGMDLLRLPFLLSGVYIAYIFPKLVGIWTSNSFLAHAYRRSGTVDVLIISAALCYFGALLGYRVTRPRNRFEDRRWVFSRRQYKVVLGIAAFILFVSIYGAISLAETTGGISSYFFDMRRYTLDWRGAEVYYTFVADFIYIPLFLLALLYSYKQNKITLILLIICCIYPLLNIFALYRRTDLIELVTTAGFVLVVYYRYRPRRIAALLMIVALAAAVLLFPEIRTAKFHEEQIRRDAVTRTLDSFAQFSDGNEIAMAAYRVQRVRNAGDFGDGTVFWNALVSQFVPRGLIGQSAKNKLYIGNDRKEYYFFGWSRSSHFYLAPIGFSQAFEEFGYFGFLIFFALGALTGVLERWRTHSLAGELMYVLMLAPVVLGISNDIQIPITKLVTYSMIFGGLWATGQLSRLRKIHREGTRPPATERPFNNLRPLPAAGQT